MAAQHSLHEAVEDIQGLDYYARSIGTGPNPSVNHTSKRPMLITLPSYSSRIRYPTASSNLLIHTSFVSQRPNENVVNSSGSISHNALIISFTTSPSAPKCSPRTQHP
jgi:hypothetical protein